MRRNWSTEEVSHLDSLLGLPIDMVAARYNEWAIANGYRTRTEKAICCKINVTLKESAKFTGTDTLKCADEWARELGISKNTLHYYLRAGYIHYRKGRKHIMITRRALVTFATQHPQFIQKISRDILIYVFGEDVGEELYRKAHSMAN